MKRRIALMAALFVVIGLVFMLTSCHKTASFYLDEEGHLIEVFDDGKESDLGEWREDIVSSVDSIEIGDDGFYIIDGVKTKINIGNSFIKCIDNIDISEDGYYVVNGVKTDILGTHFYNVSFNTGTSTTIDSQRVREGFKAEKPTITRDGYTLDGWYLNGEEWIFSDYTVMSDITLEAKWTPIEYTAYFYVEGELYTTLKFTVEDEKLKDMPHVPEKGGFIVVWSPYTIGCGDITIESLYTVQDFQIVYLNTKDVPNDNPTVYNLMSKDIVLSDLYFEGLVFDGWFNKQGEKIEVIPKGSYGHLELTARWSDPVYITDGNGTITGLTELGKTYDKLVIPVEINGEKITAIGTRAFYNCTNLVEVTIPETITKIGDQIFAGCSSLKTLYYNSYFAPNEGQSFVCNTSIETIIFGDNIKTIPGYICANCPQITCIILGKNVEELGHYCFADCTNIKTIELPDSLKNTGFYSLKGVVTDHIVIPEGISSIRNTFRDIKLNYIVIPKSLVGIVSQAFYGVDIKKVYYLGTAEDWSYISIDEDSRDIKNGTLYYYSEEKPSGTGHYWHYVDGVITEW